MNSVTSHNKKKINVNEGEVDFFSDLITGESALKKEFTIQKRPYYVKSVKNTETTAEYSKGWEVIRTGKISTRLKKLKTHDQLLESRVWCLLRKMGFSTLSGSNFKISFTRDNGTIGNKQIDVYAEDDDVIFIVECKSKEKRGRRTLQKDIQETISLQDYIRKTIFRRFSDLPKPKIVWIYATSNILWSAPDLERAEDGNIHVITENELQYYETFTKHMGPAGRYQIIGEFLKGQKIPGLSNMKVPAIRGKIGGEKFYSFVTTPRNLLKIAYVNHQALNNPDQKPAYQRMVSAKRVKEIGEFISKGGYFPTNILINLTDKPKFELISDNENTDPNLKFGWITLPSKFRSAWVIDGQHRLFGFSHLSDEYLDQSLFVLAFQQMPTRKEADLFITINHEQKSVPKGLLMSLLADIRMGDDDPSTALSALASAVIRALNDTKSSPLFGRFVKPGVPPEPEQNLTISEGINGLRRSGLIGRVNGKYLMPGPLSGATDSETVERAQYILSTYFDKVLLANPDRWEAGREAYISTNPGIRAHMTVISEVINHITSKQSLDFQLINQTEAAGHLTEFCQPVFDLVESCPDDQIKTMFSRRFGEGGVKEYIFHLLKPLNEHRPDFGNEEFQRWIEQSTSEKIDQYNQFLMKLAERLTNYVIDTLKEVHGQHRLDSDEPAYWELGVQSARIRKNAYEKQQRDDKRRKPKEAYLDIVDLEEIVRQKNNWIRFEAVFNNPREGDRKGQKYYLSWIQNFNELRNIAAHKNQLKTYTDDDLEFIEWLRTTVSPKVPE
ncbi:hypothetical protein PsAD2_00417 [Pseudovibrio axinellae]|uniref:DGQHR domain protein n=1 Tax=Pseudovibrio axinellae TaxID=989403 RepID=A0A161XGW5_9HYPH|nr:DGQHR domain-containing protein [Pseudovibrio axinellae]KZL21133.1 hypothetical protein PsAD2_00417 [Pseudovibrio axinellae]SEQ88819.1 DGQHR domain-containing protein [Pseudovibrio axinellae]